MTCKKVMLLTLSFLLFSSPCFSRGYVDIIPGATTSFEYVQPLDAIAGDFSVRINVTRRVPYEIQTVSNERTLIIT